MKRLFCASCARPLRRGTYNRCPLGCGARLCKRGSGCGNNHLPYNCSVYQENHGVAEEPVEVRAHTVHRGVESFVAPDEDGVDRLWVDEDAMRRLADRSPMGPVAANAVVDQILAACREGRVWNG